MANPEISLDDRGLLEKLAAHYGTDKRAEIHNYTPDYEALFGPIRHSVKNILEIGIQRGPSIQMWHDYFPNATVWGMDTFTDVCFKEPGFKNQLMEKLNKPRIRIVEGSQDDEDLMRSVYRNMTFDIIIDDAGHACAPQQICFRSMIHRVRRGGYYIIEDLATSDSREFLQFDDPACSTKAFIQSIIDGKPYSFYLSAVELAVLPRCFSHVELRGELGIFQIK